MAPHGSHAGLSVDVELVSIEDESDSPLLSEQRSFQISTVRKSHTCCRSREFVDKTCRDDFALPSTGRTTKTTNMCFPSWSAYSCSLKHNQVHVDIVCTFCRLTLVIAFLLLLYSPEFQETVRAKMILVRRAGGLRFLGYNWLRHLSARSAHKSPG